MRLCRILTHTAGILCRLLPMLCRGVLSQLPMVSTREGEGLWAACIRHCSAIAAVLLPLPLLLVLQQSHI